MRRTKEEAAETRETLLKSGLSVFGQKGYAATTLEDIAKVAGVTRGAIYWHFGSKADLYNALLSEFSARSAAIVERAVAEGDGLVDILRRIYVGLLTAVARDATLRSVMEISLFKTERTPDLQAGLAQRAASGRALLDGIAKAMAQGAASGELRADIDALDLARAFLASNNGVISLWLSDPSAFELEEHAEVMAEIFMSGLLPGKE
jgi:AcrR family transcriptional regulator